MTRRLEQLVRLLRARASSSAASARTGLRRAAAVGCPPLLVGRADRTGANGRSRRRALSWRSRSRYSAREVKSRYGSSTPRVTRSSTSTPMNAWSRRNDQRLPLERRRRGVDAGDQPLSGGFLVAGGAVHLAGQEEPGNRLALERGMELSRREVVVLDGVPGRVIATCSRPGMLRSSCELDRRRKEVESPFTYISVVSSPSGSRKIWCRSASGN